MSVVIARRKSPRAPSLALNEALERALRAYDKERVHAAPVEVVAQNIGYKTANSGTALAALASLRYYGLLERPKDGQLAVTKDVEDYKFAPNDSLKRSLLVGFLLKPPLFAELLTKYEGGLPSDATIRYELIERGFLPQAAEATVNAFRQSVEFAGYFDSLSQGNDADKPLSTEKLAEPLTQVAEASAQQQQLEPQLPSVRLRALGGQSAVNEDVGESDRIPIRLVGGRRAWLIIPEPFFEADKARLKAHIDLLLTQDEDD